jgi:hypothetical protein
MKVPNFKQSVKVFSNYMLKTFDFEISSVKDSKVEDVLYSTMKSIKDSEKYKHLKLTDLNNIALNEVRDIYVEKYKISKIKKTNVKILERETQVFGSRSLQSLQILPMNTNNSKDTVTTEYDRIMKIRNNNENKQTSSDIVGASETAIDINEFSSKLTSLEENREKEFIITTTNLPPVSQDQFNQKTRESDYLLTSIQTQKPKISFDPKALYQDISSTITHTEDALVIKTTPNFVNHAQYDIIPPVKKRSFQKKYLIVNGFDRDWMNQYQRFKFSVDMSGLSKPYRNISSLKFTSLIIPMEIEEHKSLLNSAPKSYYYNENKLTFPYVMLHIDEISDMYDGFNQATQKCNTQFCYDRSYKAPNGRGYILMKPMQDEVKQFTSLLGILPRLTVSVIRPNGILFNQSLDNFNIIKIDYTVYNEKFIQVTLDKYFDKNEFYIGDNIMCKHFFSETFVSLQPIPTDPCATSATYMRLAEWVNRREGHEIHQIGEANEFGFTNNFFISAPGKLDQSIGKLLVDKSLVDALRFYNQTYAIKIPNPILNGKAINTSLQIVLSMTMTLESGDMSILGSMAV